jgi:hypothetical protein
MILEEPRVDRAAFTRRTGWTFRPEGACRGDICVPMPDAGGDWLDAHLLSARLHMPLVRDDPSGLWCLGPESFGQALQTAAAPDLHLPDLDGRPFDLQSLRGRKLLLLAWASW